ncbi:Aste57867_13429 [Aphanomyces stellatus]|uniref:Aste57867_13429 protein n=1 Tax=Aphanomyces stellatus TaxID=120398 RepID=A0A485KZT2_9STRA|nr:hypothetical protein As57867_013379 [Aphanomyces stellatus]VFT90268.1 Aste57867_13429 [Aphanomyces stellatus]
MSTLTSADMGELKRPSTRLHAPPGGSSNWSFGDASTPSPAPSARNGRGTASPPPAPTAVKAPEAAPVAAAASSSTYRNVRGAIRIAVLKTKTDESVVDEFAANFTKALASSVSYEAITVPSVEELPYAANKLALHGNFDGVVAFGLLNTADAHYQVQLTAVTQALIQVSVAAVKPVVRAIFVGEPRTASVKAKGGWGADFAASIEDLVQLGGFVHRPQAVVHHHENGHHAPSSSRSRSASKSSSSVKADNNVFPDSLKSAPRSVVDSLAELRATLYEHGARGIVGLGRKFRIMDDDNSKSLDLNEFKKAIREHALDLTESEVADLFAFFDDDRSGNISYDEFLVGVRGELNERRTQLVLLAFGVIDADGNGLLELDDIIAKYNADKHPDVIAGRKTKNEVFRDFLDTFDGGEKDGKVTPAEFVRYYANVSASIDDDDYFELMIRNAWHISGGEGWSANSTCRRVLVTHADGTQSVEEVKNDIGVSGKDAIAAALKKQGVADAAAVETSGYVENQTKAKAQPNKGKKLQHGAGESSIVFG